MKGAMVIGTSRWRKPLVPVLAAALVLGAAWTTAVPATGEPKTAALGSPAAWSTWVLPSADQFRAGRPPRPRSRVTRKELKQIRRLQKKVTKRERRLIKRWARGAATLPWTQVNLDMILIHRPGAFPTRSARSLGLLHVGMFDAMVAAYDSRGQYRRKPPFKVDRDIDRLVKAPGSSYPDVYAAIAGAAETILTYLFPQEDPSTFRRLSDQATKARLVAGVSYKSDVRVGRRIGNRVGELVVQYAMSDGTHLPPDDVLNARLCSTPTCGQDPADAPNEEYWVPTPLAFQWPPTDPAVAMWDTWLLTSSDQFRPPPPPAYGSPEFMAELAEVKETNDNATSANKQLGYFWDDGPGTYSPAGHWNDIALGLLRSAKVKTPEASLIFAVMNAAIVDAFIASWEAKYHYWSIRPVTVIRSREFIGTEPNPYYDPGWLPNIDTPPFPAYSSGHTGESAAAARVLQYFFPDEGQDPTGLIGNYATTGTLDAIAEEVGFSRLVGGIHYRSDNEAALVLGRRVADLAMQWAQANGTGSVGRAPVMLPAAARYPQPGHV